MKTQLKSEQKVLKYYQALKTLHEVLKFTPKVSLLEFSKKNKLSRNLGMALQKGGVIKKTGKGVGVKYQWVSIPPTREMAIKTLDELSKATTKPKEKVKKVATKQKEKLKLIGYELKLFWGLVRLMIKPIYN